MSKLFLEKHVGLEFEPVNPSNRPFLANIKVLEVGGSEFWVENVDTGSRRAVEIADFSRDWQHYVPTPKAEEIWHNVPPKLGAVRVKHVVDDWVLYTGSDTDSVPLQARRVDDFTNRYKRAG